METLKKELRELVKENKITKDKKYYSLNYDTLKEKITGEVDFGKDGRIIIIDSGSKQHINIVKNMLFQTILYQLLRVILLIKMIQNMFYMIEYQKIQIVIVLY